MFNEEKSEISRDGSIFEEFEPDEEPAHESALDLDLSDDAPVEDNQRSCTIIGPANSGKTTLLLAMQQACLQGGDQYQLDFVPESETAAGLVGLAGEFLFHGKTVRASRTVTNYSFRIFVNNLHKQERESFCRLNVTDGPGGFLFPGERGSSNVGALARKDLLAITRQARSLVLCVDGSAPALETLYQGLPQLILELKGQQRRLPYLRVLLLVTKIDRVISKFREQAWLYNSQSAFPFKGNPALDSICSGTASPVTTARVAKLLHPLEQARQLFGKLIDMVQAGLAPTATFAVGLCSALGFHRQTGASFVDSEAGSSTETMAERLRDWEPFGVREAILFLVADQIRHPLYEVLKNSASTNSWNVRVPLHV